MKKHPVLILIINQHQQGVTTNGSYRAPGKSRPKTRRRIPWQVSWLAGPRLLPTFPGWSRVAFSGSCLTAHSCGYSRRSGLKISPALLRSLLFPGYSPLWETTEEDEKLQQRFWDLIGPDKLKSPDLRIGAEYLRDNQELLK